MRRSRFMKYALSVAALVCSVIGSTLSVQAQDYPLPHLIQTVTEQDIYEGMLSLGLLETAVLEETDCAKAYENVQSCIVRVQMGNAHGSGIIWKMTPDGMVIATNKHVLEYWEDENSYVYFAQGYYTDAQVIGISEQYDVGFLYIDNGQFTYEQLKQFRSARTDETVYDGLRQGDVMFSVDSGSDTEKGQYFEATVEDPHRYIEDFEAYMLYGHGFAREGMSGGGTFDGRGYLIGMTTGGTYYNETAGVPLPDIEEAYKTVVQGKIVTD